MPLKTLFTIGAERRESDTLLLEIGRNYCTFAFVHHHNRTFEQIRYISYEEWESEESLKGIFEELRSENFQRVVVSSALTTALLVPQAFFHGDYSLLDRIYDLPRQQHL